MKTLEQLPLPLRLGSELPHLAQFDFDGNGLLDSELQARLSGRSNSALLLVGPHGSGKSYLLAASAQFLLEHDRGARLLPLRKLAEHSPDTLGLESPDTVWLLDDLDQVIGRRDWEIALFALFNRQHDAQLPVLASCLVLPEAAAFALPDLASRLQQMTRLSLRPLDEKARLRVLRAHAVERGLELPEPLIDWLQVHFSRDLSRLLPLLAELDRYSLSRGRRLSIPLVREHLAAANAARAPTDLSEEP